MVYTSSLQVFETKILYSFFCMQGLEKHYRKDNAVHKG
jgi:hypothetical protein